MRQEPTDSKDVKKQTTRTEKSENKTQGRGFTQEPTELTHALNELLANEFGLFTKTLNYHWNVTGPRFHSLHIFLEEHYKALLIIIDDVAEKVRILHGRPTSTVKELRSTMNIDEAPGEYPSADQMLADLMGDHEMIQKEIKAMLKEHEEEFEDQPGIEDFVIDVLKEHEKFAWMLRSHLEK